jgi:Predicted permease, DMT superfamily
MFVLLGLTGGSLYFMAENTALGITFASNVSLILCTTPLLTAFLTFLFYKKEKSLNKNFIIGSCIAILGVALVVYNGSFVLKVSPLGDFLTFIAAITWAFYSVILVSLGKTYTSSFITRKVFFYGIITLIPFLPFYPITLNWNIISTPVVMLNLLFLGVIASMLCFLSWNIAVKKIGTIQTSNYLYLVPFVTMIASSVILDEHITTIAIIGSIFILLGVYFGEKK